MSDLVIRIGASNLVLSASLALIAWSVQRSGKRPLVAHVLWLLVLVKLFTPALVHVPVISGLAGNAAALALPAAPAPGSPIGDAQDALGGAALPSEVVWGRPILLLWSAWLLGSLVVLGVTLVRIVRFDRLLNRAEEPANSELRALAEELGGRFGLRAAPLVVTTTARIAPMVWWTIWSRRARVVVPDTMARSMSTDDLRWVLAHEFAHVRRRDHLVRWVEWLSCVAFWWNPVVWWARRNLRVNEELCCDALVLATLRPDPRQYAASLLDAVELIAVPSLRLPAAASAINNGGELEQRLRAIVSGRPFDLAPRWARAAALAGALMVLPLGLASASMGNEASAGEPRAATEESGTSLDWLAGAVHERGVSRERIEHVLGAIELLAQRTGTTRRDPEQLAGELFGELDLTREELGLTVAFARGLVAGELASPEDTESKTMPAAGVEDHFASLGVSAGLVQRMRESLLGAGLEGEIVESALGALLRVVQEIQSEGDDFELDPRLESYLVRDLLLTTEQIDLLVGLARRAAHG